MWAAKLPGEGAALYDACTAMCKVMSELGIAVDGGKDSLSMAARVDGDIVKAPGMYVLQANRTLEGSLQLPHDRKDILFICHSVMTGNSTTVLVTRTLVGI